MIHRMRKRYGEFLRSEIAQTVADSQDIDQEIRYFIGILGRPRAL